MSKERVMYPWMNGTEVETQSMCGFRNPTKAEIAFGYGATHYRCFPIEMCVKKDGEMKRRLFAKDEGLWYTLGA